MKILKYIFSIDNIDEKVFISVLGINFKFNRPKSEPKYILEHIFCYFIHLFFKVKKNKIVFINLTNWQYADNPKYIANEFLKSDNKKLDFVWIRNMGTDRTLIPKRFRIVKYLSLKALFEMMTAKVWVINANPFLLYKKGLLKNKETVCIQTWHGSMGIKRESNDVKNNKAYESLGWAKWQKIVAANTDYFIADSKFEEVFYKSAFWGYGNVVKLGKARDVIFYENQIDFIDKIKSYYNIPSENKILLYAPTWRTDKRCDCYNIDIRLLKKTLRQKYNCDWSVLIRPHYLMPKEIFNALYDINEVINVSAYPDMQELLVASDMLISDYSSCIPEYTILKKPSFIYATDIDKYENGFYYPLSTLPSPVSTDNGELTQQILNLNIYDFKVNCDKFLLSMGHENDINCCKRIVEFILKVMNG
ncbi:CDP-glycerol glycerophosphotransferase family protein [bacterium]|nr:CDP-glycerol glycerophosphotransferase family protein [bacterium]